MGMRTARLTAPCAAASAAARFETHNAAALNAWLTDLLPQSGAVIMDVGAGSGRDAAWLASLGHEVLAVEPSAAMRAEAHRLHAQAGLRIEVPSSYDPAALTRTALIWAQLVKAIAEIRAMALVIGVGQQAISG